jgi:HEAT repeat protein
MNEGLAAALDGLRTYDHGSSRADLLPIDRAVANAAKDPATRAQLEQKLVRLLSSSLPEAAQEYACGKLALIGSAACAPELAKLLVNPRVAAAARTALEAIPDAAAGKALVRSLSTLNGSELAGAVHSLGTRRDQQAERALTKLLRYPDARVARAAATALGQLGSPRAAKALRAFLKLAPESLRMQTADACLKCAEARAKAGDSTSAIAVRQALQAEGMPSHVRKAAASASRSAQLGNL